MTRVLEALLQRFEFVILSTAYLPAYSDATSIASRVDATILARYLGQDAPRAGSRSARCPNQGRRAGTWCCADRHEASPLLVAAWQSPCICRSSTPGIRGQHDAV